MDVSATLLDTYVHRASPVHRADARVKVLLTLAAIVAVNLTPHDAWAALAALALLVLATGLAARLCPADLLGRSLIALPFVLMAGAGVPFATDGRPLLALSVMGLPLAITDAGLLRLAALLARAWVSLLAAATLTLTTRFTEILAALRALGLPPVLVATLGLMYRYLFVLVDEAQRLLRAREARSAESGGQHGGRTLVWRARVSAHMIGTLFLRTYERSERIYRAMLARGYSGEVRLLQPSRLTARERLWAGATLVLLALVVALARRMG